MLNMMTDAYNLDFLIFLVVYVFNCGEPKSHYRMKKKRILCLPLVIDILKATYCSCILFVDFLFYTKLSRPKSSRICTMGTRQLM